MLAVRRAFLPGTSLHRTSQIVAVSAPGTRRLSVEARRNGPLTGLRVIDASRVLAGPFCSQILADYGADVVKIEQPGTGDETRHWKSDDEAARWTSSTMSLYFSSVNRNKRSITLDLKKPEALKVVRDLVRDCDVFMENFIPGKAQQLGLSYEELASVNTKLIYASLSGYGPSGPSAERAGYDAIAAAEGGLMHITGHKDGPPARPGLGMTDMSTGLFLHGAILAALHARSQHPEHRGQHISASLFETQLALLINVGTLNLNTSVEPTRWGAAHPSIVPYNTYETGDDRWLALGANNDRQFGILSKALGKDEWTHNDRFKTNSKRVENRTELDGLVASLVKSKPLSDWLKRLEGSGLAYGPINTVGEALTHPQAIARGMIQDVECKEWQAVPSSHAEGAVADSGRLKVIGPPVKFSASSAQVRTRAPLLGEHTEQILEELGYDQASRAQLQRDSVV